MKNLVHKAAALLLAALLVLSTAACGEAPAKTEPASQPAKIEADTKAPSTEPQTSEAPATEPPTAEEPTTAAPALVSGRYDLFDLPMNGGTETVEKYAANGLYYFLVIEDGGKGYIHSAGEENEITWNEKSINVGGSDVSYKAEDGVLTIYRKNQPYQLYRLSDDPAPARGETMKKVLGLFRTDEITLENVTLADTADYTIAVKGITPPKKPYDPYTLVLSLTSKYAGDKLGFSFSHVVINGITIPADLSSCSCSVNPGENKEYELKLSLDAMKKAGVGDPTRIDLYTRVKPDYQPKDMFLDYLTLYPLGEDKAETVTRQAGGKDQLIEDNDKIRLSFIGITGLDIINYYHICFWLENKTDTVACSQVFIHTINGTDARFFSTDEIAPHSACMLDAFMNPESLNGLVPEAITDIAFSFDFSTNSVNPKTITEGEYSFKP